MLHVEGVQGSGDPPEGALPPSKHRHHYPTILRYTVRLRRARLSCCPYSPCCGRFPEPVDADGSAPTASAPRKVYDTRDDDRAPGLHGDYDDDKYRRRPALGWLAQLLRYTGSGGAGCQERGERDVRARGPGHDSVLTKVACPGQHRYLVLGLSGGPSA